MTLEKNYIFNKIKSPYLEYDYVVKNNYTIENIFKKFSVKKEEIASKLKEVYVQMKLSEIKDRLMADEIVPEISRCANSQNKVKSKILELVGQWITNPLGSPPIIGLCGPPGIGKTTLIRSLADSLQRPFAFMSMGGMRDGTELKGHSQTYVGSIWGKFTQIIMISGHATVQIAVEATRLGAYEFIEKPFSKEKDTELYK